MRRPVPVATPAFFDPSDRCRTNCPTCRTVQQPQNQRLTPHKTHHGVRQPFMFHYSDVWGFRLPLFDRRGQMELWNDVFCCFYWSFCRLKPSAARACCFLMFFVAFVGFFVVWVTETASAIPFQVGRALCRNAERRPDRRMDHECPRPACSPEKWPAEHESRRRAGSLAGDPAGSRKRSDTEDDSGLAGSRRCIAAIQPAHDVRQAGFGGPKPLRRQYLAWHRIGAPWSRKRSTRQSRCRSCTSQARDPLANLRSREGRPRTFEYNPEFKEEELL